MEPSAGSLPTVTSGVKLVGGLLFVFAVFHLLGSVLHSDRGQAGILIGVIIVGATLICQWLIFGGGFVDNLHKLGLGAPSMRGMLVVALICALLLVVLPFYAAISGNQIGIATQWLWTIPGLFFQAGIAEETLFRGYLFGRIRDGRSFWRSALLSAIPFAFVHLILFFTMPFPVAAAAFLLSVIMSFPFAYLYELGGRTIWAPALLHFVVQGAIKLVAISNDAMQGLAIVWIAASASIPWLVFLLKRRPLERVNGVT